MPTVTPNPASCTGKTVKPTIRPLAVVLAVAHGLLPWMFDALGKTYMQTPYRGNFDSATYTIDASKQFTIPQNKGGGKVDNIRGVWLKATKFKWDGYYAEVLSGDSTDYLDSYVNNPADTVVTVDNSLAEGTEVQVYYFHSNSTLTGIHEVMDPYPCWQRGEDTEIWTAAVDAEQWLLNALMEAYQAVGANEELASAACACSKELLASLQEFGQYQYSGAMDAFPTLLQRHTGGFYDGSGDDGSLDSFAVVTDPEDGENKVLKVIATIGTGSQAYAYWGHARVLGLANATRFSFDFIGEGNEKRYLITLNNDPDGTYDEDYLFFFSFPDTSTAKISYSVLLSAFLKIKNIPYDGDRRQDTPYTYDDGTSTISVNDFLWGVNEDDLVHYYAKKIVWALSGADPYAGLGFNNHLPSPVSSAGTSKITLFIGASQETVVRVLVYDDGNEVWYEKITVSPTARRYEIDWSDMSKYPDYQPPDQDNNNVLNHPIAQIQIQVNGSDNPGLSSGEVYLADIRFDDGVTIEGSSDCSYYQFDFPQGGDGTFTAYFDNIYFDVQTTDAYPGLPKFVYMWDGGDNILEWMEGSRSGYMVPAAFYLRGELAFAQRMVAFLQDAQDEYTGNYSPAYDGPFMPIYYRNSPENRDYGTLETWGWNSAEGDLTWAGYQYRALVQTAWYYYLTGDPTAKGILDKWMTWIDNNVITDSGYPGPPQGYKAPSTFTAGTGNFTYDYWSAYFHALIAQVCIFKYWRDGDATADTWYRRLLDDLQSNRKLAAGNYTGQRYGYVDTAVGAAFGMLINGRTGGLVDYPLSATQADKNAFEELYAYFINGRDNETPCSLSPDYLPLHRGDGTIEQFGSVYFPGNCSTTEDISHGVLFALDCYVYSEDDTWISALLDFVKSVLKI